jgi:exodeoxyribonuclease VII large subunit
MKKRSPPSRSSGPEPELFSWPFSSGRESKVHLPPPEPIEQVIPGATPASAIAVSELAQMAKAILEGAFMPVWIRGEVTDFKSHRNGHWYFCLRDAGAQVRCVVWSRDQRRMPAPPEDGMQVVALGQLGFYPTRGEVQLSIKAIDAEGDGLWRKAMERTRARLEAEGLFAPSRKRAMPFFPRRIAVITSPDGAALRDIIAVARRRCSLVEIVVVPARVQGDGASDDLCEAVEQVGRWMGADVVIIGRGGGGREDLWAFNDERLARAVAACPIPTISAVGHEVDMTICDLVADLRAPTPSAAAEHAVPMLDDLTSSLRVSADRLRTAIDDRMVAARDAISMSAARLRMSAEDAVNAKRTRIEQGAARLNDLSPVATLGRGYAVARDASGRTLGTTAAFTPGLPFDLLLRDGRVRATAEEIVRQEGPA